MDTWHGNRPRFVTFDSFSGLPDGDDVERHLDYSEGAYACTERQFINNVKQGGVNIDDVRTVASYYDDTLTVETKTRLNLRKAAIVIILCDLYESTVPVLDFITDLVDQGTIIIFDDWYHFKGSRNHGEQRTCYEWLRKNPHIDLVKFWQQGPQSPSLSL